MCFVIKKGRHAKEQTAKEDIIVYKIIKPDNRSLFRDFQYSPNTLYRLRKKLKKSSYGAISQGFHSYSVKSLASSLYKKRVKFVIPKGAKYYYNPVDNECVSSSIRSGDLVAL